MVGLGPGDGFVEVENGPGNGGPSSKFTNTGAGRCRLVANFGNFSCCLCILGKLGTMLLQQGTQHFSFRFIRRPAGCLFPGPLDTFIIRSSLLQYVRSEDPGRLDESHVIQQDQRLLRNI